MKLNGAEPEHDYYVYEFSFAPLRPLDESEAERMAEYRLRWLTEWEPSWKSYIQ